VSTPDPALDVLWKNVLDNWGDDKAHAGFLEHCRENDQLVEAAVRYRGMTGDRDRGASAEKRLEAVTLVALAKLESSRSPPAPESKRIASWLLVILFVVLSVLLLTYLGVQR
jgi:hypothetical protein